MHNKIKRSHKIKHYSSLQLGEICKTRLVHGCRSQEIMARLNESLKYGPSYFNERLLASHQIRCLKKCAIVTLHNHHGLTLLNIQKLTTAGTENSSVAATKYCNNYFKIANFKINIIQNLVLVSR